jgi:hypothetical protein
LWLLVAVQVVAVIMLNLVKAVVVLVVIEKARSH